MQRYCACHPPAMGHVFRAETLTCDCGWGWFAHQQDPKPCPRPDRLTPALHPAVR